MHLSASIIMAPYLHKCSAVVQKIYFFGTYYLERKKFTLFGAERENLDFIWFKFWIIIIINIILLYYFFREICILYGLWVVFKANWIKKSPTRNSYTIIPRKLIDIFWSEKRFYIRGTLRNIRIPRLAKVSTFYRDWLKPLK